MKTVIISLGGSLIVPKDIDISFLKEFKATIEAFVKDGNKAVIVTGGGKPAREYITALNEIGTAAQDAQDWVGIAGTRLNAQLVREMFGDLAHEEVITNPTERVKTDKNIIIGAGYLPGHSTDMDAVHMAHTFKTKTIINMSNIDHVYDKDPKTNDDAKPLEEISWGEMITIVGTEWDPGANLPFDPVACQKAKEAKLTVIVVGKDISNLQNILDDKAYEGTTIK